MGTEILPEGFPLLGNGLLDIVLGEKLWNPIFWGKAIPGQPVFGNMFGGEYFEEPGFLGNILCPKYPLRDIPVEIYCRGSICGNVRRLIWEQHLSGITFWGNSCWERACGFKYLWKVILGEHNVA